MIAILPGKGDSTLLRAGNPHGLRRQAENYLVLTRNLIKV
jgi:hypothetical protein